VAMTIEKRDHEQESNLCQASHSRMHSLENRDDR
jgi:hypothetical protein